MALRNTKLGPLTKVEEIIGISFRNKKFLVQALIHASYLNEDPKCPFECNERQEFLGDAVLEFIVTQYLFRTFPEKREGELTNMRSALVSTVILSEVAQDLQLNSFLYLSRGEKQDFERKISSAKILAGALEALIGAIYLDRGIGTAEIFILEYFIPKLQKAVENMLFTDPKSFLQELSQEKLHITPCYEVLKKKGLDHRVLWTMGVFLEEKLVGKGQGLNQAEAEKEAARQAMTNVFKVLY